MELKIIKKEEDFGKTFYIVIKGDKCTTIYTDNIHEPRTLSKEDIKFVVEQISNLDEKDWEDMTTVKVKQRLELVDIEKGN